MLLILTSALEELFKKAKRNATMVRLFAWKQVKQNVSRTVTWREEQKNISFLDFEPLQNQRILPDRQADSNGPKRPRMT